MKGLLSVGTRMRLMALVAVVLTASGQGAARVQDLVPNAADDRIRRLLDAGSYADAEVLGKEAVLAVENEGGNPAEVARILDLLVEAKLKNGKSASQETLDLATRAIQVKQQLVGSIPVDLAISLHNFGLLRSQRGEAAAALLLHERALALRTSAPDVPATLVADSLDHVAFAQIQLERFTDADRTLRRALTIRESVAQAEPVALARTLGLVGLLHRSSGNYSAAIEPLERALELRLKHAPGHPDIAGTMLVRGDVWLLSGDSTSAQGAWSRALELTEAKLGATHPQAVEALRRLGLAASAQGNLAAARELRERALGIGLSVLAPCDPTLVDLLNTVANSRGYDGDYAEARRLYQRALTTINECSAAAPLSNAADVRATTLYNSADLARDMGDFGEAQRLYQQAIDVWSRGLGPRHPFVARGTDALAEVTATLGNFEQARSLYESALANRRTSLGAAHPQVAWTQANLAKMFASAGRLKLATRHADEALAVIRISGGDEPDHLARVLLLKGSIDERLGNLEAARARFDEALAERERAFGTEHPLVADARAAVAAVQFLQGRHREAATAALVAERVWLNHLRSTVRYLPERPALAFAGRRPPALDLVLSIAAVDADLDVGRAFAALVQSRGAILEELAARSHWLNSADRHRDYDDGSLEARQRLASLVVRSLREPVPRALLDRARRSSEEADRARAERSAELREPTSPLADFEHIRLALPADSALVSFVRYVRTFSPEPGSQSKGHRAELAYAAFVLGPQAQVPSFVPLGSAEVLDGRVNAWRFEAAGQRLISGEGAAEARYRVAAQRLRQLVWDPLANLLSNAARVYIVPDGRLSLVNFAALTDDTGKYLVEREPTLHYLTTERDLLRPHIARPSTGSLIAVGGATFGEGRIPAAPRTSIRGGACQHAGLLQFASLPESLREVNDISDLWSTSTGLTPSVLRGSQATEGAVKRAVAGHRVMHLATHGFLLGDRCAPSLSGTRSVGGLAPVTGARPKNRNEAARPPEAENPLVMSGLAFAGANLRASASREGDDGILTAEEVASLDLDGVEWAVLSACDTGLGEIRAGEGVFGLRRAFQIAGVRTVIMSLWSVEDEATRQWMRALYEGRLQRRLDTADAVREASLSVLRDRRAKGLSTHPFYWAAFVAAGDWR